jgi:hypothetical protein
VQAPRIMMDDGNGRRWSKGVPASSLDLENIFPAMPIGGRTKTEHLCQFCVS